MRHIGQTGFVKQAGLVGATVIILLFDIFLLSSRGIFVREWISVNLLTLSTKQKQKKYLDFAERHMAEPEIYAEYLRQAEYMAEAILFLDGGQIAVADGFEAATREQEQILARQRPLPYEALAASRIENEKIFDYLVKNYQFNQADIKKYQGLVDQHIAIVESLTRGKLNAKIAAFLAEARKYQAAGLNIEAYEYVKKAKDAVYSQIQNPKVKNFEF